MAGRSSWLRLPSEPALILPAVLTGVATGFAAVGSNELIHAVSRVGLDQVHHAQGWLRMLLSVLVPVGGSMRAPITAVVLLFRTLAILVSRWWTTTGSSG